MYLEILDIPNLDMHGGALAFAHVPWVMPLTRGATLRERVMSAVHAWHESLGIEPRVRLVFERPEEYAVAYGDAEIAAFPSQLSSNRMIAQYLGIDSVVARRDDKLTPMEQSAAAQIYRVAEEYVRSVGGAAAIYLAEDETSRQNLTRPAESIGLAVLIKKAEQAVSS